MTFQPPTTPQLIAHMGDSSFHPANTIAAIESAVALGVDMVEIDVSISVDDVLVATHGPRLDRWTDGQGHVHRLPWSHIRELRARHGVRGPVSEELVPSLAEVLDVVAGRIPVNLDIKRSSGAVPAIEAVAGGEQEYVLSGLTPRQARRVRRRFPDVPVLVNLNLLGKLVARSRHLRTRWLCRRSQRELYADPNVIALNLNHEWIDPDLVGAVHAAGAQVWVFTAETNAEIDAAYATGADSVTVNDPGLVLARH